MNFGGALEALKAGHRVTREGWNGKNMWLALMTGLVVPADKVNARTKVFVPDGDLHVGPYIVLWTAQGMWQPGWVAWSPDMLAEDWVQLPDVDWKPARRVRNEPGDPPGAVFIAGTTE